MFIKKDNMIVFQSFLTLFFQTSFDMNVINQILHYTRLEGYWAWHKCRNIAVIEFLYLCIKEFAKRILKGIGQNALNFNTLCKIYGLK